ncbi:MAG: competence/damage-inducible protein A [Planctomycetota bacterium]|jgi:nicotinamide-nucleotide amidase
MKKASIVSIGDELLSGQTLNSNASFLAGRLLSIGIPVVSSYTIGDDVDSIGRVLSLASSDADVVLATGGLGPTDDDLTRKAFAKFLGVDLRLDSGLLGRIREFFAMRKLQMPEKNKVQAYVPVGAEALENEVGSAPGILAEVGAKLLVALPGVPAEMKQMFEKSVLDVLGRTGRSAEAGIAVRKLKCFGTGESTIAELLGPLMQRGRNPLINCTVQHGEITLHVIATAENKGLAQEMAKKDENTLKEILGDLVFGTGEQTLAEVVGQKLVQKKRTIAVAESCTGGALAKLITAVPGASEYFIQGWITYSDEAKSRELGVSADMIAEYGAVSEQVAQAMAQRARKRAGTNFAIGITGIAGPTGGSEQKPVGLVYISVDSESWCETHRFIFPHDRGTIRLRAAQTALNMLRMRLWID